MIATPEILSKHKKAQTKNLVEPEPEQTVFSDEEESGRKYKLTSKFDNSEIKPVTESKNI